VVVTRKLWMKVIKALARWRWRAWLVPGRPAGAFAYL